MPTDPTPIPLLRTGARRLAFAGAVGVVSGIAAAGFLVALDGATAWRTAHPWLIALLPLGGLGIGLLYQWAGAPIAGGSHLVFAEARGPTRPLPRRLAPMVAIGTVATHLFGGSAGREGTAVQMGAALADGIGRPLRLVGRERRLLLLAGIAGGFGAVFGTPFAGAVFALEVIALGPLRRAATLPCLLAAVVGHLVVLGLGVQHTPYPAIEVPAVGVALLLAAAAVGGVCGLVARAFVAAQRAVRALAERATEWMPLRLAAGGAVVALAVHALGTDRHIGLSLPLLGDAFAAPLPVSDSAIKLALTAITLGCGFKGGEVTPLFVIGATLGSASAALLPQPGVGLFAALGLVATFAGAARTPVACVVLAVELFGIDVALPAAVACAASRLTAGAIGIYATPERVIAQGPTADVPPDAAIADAAPGAHPAGVRGISRPVREIRGL